MNECQTEFKLIFEGNQPTLKIDKFQQSLPAGFQVIKKDDGIYVAIKSANVEDQQSQYLIDRELDRHFFLTNVKIKAAMIRKVVSTCFTSRWRIQEPLRDDIWPQNWNYSLAVQLRLWSIAVDSADVMVKIILLFQIIELASPQFQPYTDPTQAPDPLTECKFIRHLVAHAGDVDRPQLKLYCEYIGMPPVMMDITDPDYYKIIASKVSLVQGEAKKIIESAL